MNFDCTKSMMWQG